MMEHIFIPGKNPALPPLVLLHGTGGDERSLLQIAELIAPDAAVLAFRGDVPEQGANRFFARYADGSFDLESLAEKTEQLMVQTAKLATEYDLVLENAIAVGYSNGANIAANAILTREDGFRKAILFHAMPSGAAMPEFSLAGATVFLTAGVNDPLISAEGSQQLIDLLVERDAVVTDVWTQQGHQLTLPEVEAARDWYGTLL